MHELVIRGGTVVDGTGSTARRADVAVDGGVIAAVGLDVGDGHRTIDASGCVVTPGFIDPHTHLDVQLFWDPSATPSCLHGVTTVVLSSCGFGIAPSRAGGKEYLLRSLEAVEEIPYETTAAAVDIGWTTWSEYIDALGALQLGVNVAGYVPHSALRVAVMGDDASSRAATGDELEAMVDALGDALAAGAVGFSSSRGPNHVDGAGRPVPSRLAGDDELAALAAACEDRIWQINVASKFGTDSSTFIAEIERYAGWSGAATLTWSPLFVQRGNETWRDVLAHNRGLQEGHGVAPQVAPQPITSAVSFAEASPLLFGITGWREPLSGFAMLDVDAQADRLRDADARRAFREAGHDGRAMLDPRFHDWIVAWSPSRPDLCGQPVARVADGTAGHPVDAFLDLVIDDRLETVVQIPLINDDVDAVAEVLVDETTLIGLGDSGAHVNTVTSYAYPTRLLTTFVGPGRLTLEEAVRRMTSHPASLFGITDRGTLRVGLAADVCVLDLDRLELLPSEIRADLPAGATRLYQGARGYRAVIVNGRPTVLDDEVVAAGARSTGPGRMLRV